MVTILWGDCKEIHAYDYPHERCLEREYIVKEVIPNSIYKKKASKFLDGHWTLLILKELLIDNNIKYNELQRKEEDRPIIMKCLRYARRMVFVNECFYNYISRDDSLVHTYSNRFENVLYNMKLYEEMFEGLYDFTGADWQKNFIRNFEECIGYVWIHRKSVANVKAEIMKIIKHPKSKHTFESWERANLFLKNMYKRDAYKVVYGYYMIKFIPLRVKLLLRDLICRVK